KDTGKFGDRHRILYFQRIRCPSPNFPSLFGVKLASRKTGERSSPVGAPMKTGQDVMEPGLYVSECCGEEVLLDKDASFPRCQRCKGLSEWELVDTPEEQAA